MMNTLKNSIRKKIVHKLKNNNEILVSDTTLRDGEQMPEVFFTPEEKTEIAKYLKNLGVHSIDAGFPIVSEGERVAIKKVVKNVKGITKPVITTLSRAKKQDIDASYDVLKDLNVMRRGISIFLGSSPQHRRKLGKTKKEIVEMIRNSVEYAKNYFDIISFSPEDASRTEFEFLKEIYEQAIESGASAIGFTDTVGILTPEKTKEYINFIGRNVKGLEDVVLAVHFHNDLGLAVANTLEAIKTNYVSIFQGTIGGIGERSGNTAIEPVIMALEMHKDEYKKKTKIKTELLTESYNLVRRLSQIGFNPFNPIVGENIFRTEAGIHQDGILKNPDTYEIFSPEKVGQSREFVIGKHSGRHAIINIEGREEKIYSQVKNYCDNNGIISDSQLLGIIEKVNENS